MIFTHLALFSFFAGASIVGATYNETITETVSTADSYASAATFPNVFSEAAALADSYASGGTFTTIWTVVTPAGGTWTPQ